MMLVKSKRAYFYLPLPFFPFSSGSRWSECLLKLEPDTWLLLRRLNNREVYLIFRGKKLDVNRVTGK